MLGSNFWKKFPDKKPTDTKKVYVIFDGQAQTIRKWDGKRFFGIEDKKFLWKEYRK